jgi:hypothetical protein
LLSLLPDVLPVPSSRADTGLDTTLRLLAQEITRPQPGTAAVLNRIVDILLVELMRTWLDTGPAHAHVPSWLSALTDPVAGPASAPVSSVITAATPKDRIDADIQLDGAKPMVCPIDVHAQAHQGLMCLG